jgi:hypothetical protein
MTNERIIGKDLEGSGHVLIELLSQHLLGGPEKKALCLVNMCSLL